MKTRLLLAALLALLLPPAVQAEDDWSGTDKSRHFAVSAVLGAVAGAHMENRWAAFGVAMIPGLVKELADSHKDNGRFSGKDLAADALGAALGVQLGHWWVSPRGVAYRAAF